MPAITYFRDTPGFHFHEIDGERSVEEIHKDVVSHISLS